MKLNLNRKLLLLNNAVVIAAKLLIFITLFHFVWTTSYIHAVIIAVAYLTIEVMDLQLKNMVQGGIKDLYQSTTTPELKIVPDTDPVDPNETSH